jgi:hypothetical protein
MLLTNKRYAKLGLAFERKIQKILAKYGAKAQVPAGGGFADFVITAPYPAVVEVKRTLRKNALIQAQRYAQALGISTIVLVAARLAEPPETFGVTEIITSFDDISPGINILFWRI